MPDLIDYLPNAQGHLVPLDKIKPLDMLRHELVIDIINRSKAIQAELQAFKKAILGDIDAFITLAAEQYDTTLGGRKGNLSLVSFDGRYKVLLAVSDTLAFDERLQLAKQLIDECIHQWVKDSDGNVKALIEHAFQTDKEGNINIGRVLGLFRLDIKDSKWQKAMEALKDSISVVASKSYLRFYERTGDEGKYCQISLDLAAL